ncbi:hypothetical protein Acr_21g0003500 [Actinidia rufa]|uniref:DUF7812 domain-containing protein n=1 Tax=Actinidia rufa TaxID=165716 RepID=A0A7J0GG86_9ERIC|nr:hypothetical protein Acr_21g0003500 [Actinidia rufa]
MCHSSHGDIGNVIEIISTHFCLSFSDGQAFENFPNGLFCLDREDFRVPELSLAASLVLLLNPLMISAPKFLHAHLISLVSETITIGMGLENMKPDVRLMDRYLSALERSVMLYVKHMSTLQMNDFPAGDENYVLKCNKYGGNSQPSFESYIQPVTRKKINNLISKFDNSWQLQLHDMFLRTKSDLATSSIAYIKESKHILDISFRDEITSILSCIILTAFSYEGCLKTLTDFSSCKEYDSIVGVIRCFQQFKVCLPVQMSLCGMMESHPEQHKESKLILLHLSGLLSLSFSTGLDFLVKSCISTMISLMNLFVFEEGNLHALQFDYRSDSFSSGLHPDNVQEAIVGQKSSLTVASKFQNIQTLYLRYCVCHINLYRKCYLLVF